MRTPVRAVLDGLLVRSESSGAVSLDEIGDAIGAMAIGQDEIDAIIDALEKAGRRVGEPAAALGEGRLRAVLEAAKALRLELGRAPTAREVAERAGLSADEVSHALALAKVMQR